LLHREDGPAYIHPTGYQAWYKRGKLHREDGPAVIYPEGTKKWFLNGLFQKEEIPKPTKINWKTEGF
jgi:hypothetical protein